MPEHDWSPYRRIGVTELRPSVPGEDLRDISVSPQDTPQAGGWIARNPANHADQWYVNAKDVEANMEAVEEEPPGLGFPDAGNAS